MNYCYDNHFIPKTNDNNFQFNYFTRVYCDIKGVVENEKVIPDELI